MLVLTRREGETLRIGPDITVTIVRTKGREIKVGVQAPRHVKILRGELPEEGKKDGDISGDQ